MAEYRKGEIKDEADILDFINYVFSQSHRPYDFRTLIAKVYAHRGFSTIHEIAVTDGRIRGTVAVLTEILYLSKMQSPKIGYIGSVSTHPYDRGVGHMTELMKRQIQNAYSAGLDMMVLGGMRHRYGFYGFDRGAVAIVFNVNMSNYRHVIQNIDNAKTVLRKIEHENDSALCEIEKIVHTLPFTCTRPDENFFEKMTTWYGSLYAVEESSIPCGCVYQCRDSLVEIMLNDKRNLAAVVKTWMEMKDEMTVRVPIYDTEQIAYFKSVAENWQIVNTEMIKVLDWKKTIQALLQFKSNRETLTNGTFILEIYNYGRYAITVKEGNVTVEDTNMPSDRSMNENMAISLLFSNLSITEQHPLLRSWLPLPFYIFRPDQF